MRYPHAAVTLALALTLVAGCAAEAEEEPVVIEPVVEPEPTFSKV